MLCRRARHGVWTACWLVTAAAPAAAHGFGQRYDLPLPLSHYIWGAGATVAFSFLAAAIFLKTDGAVAALPILRLPLNTTARAVIATLVRTTACGVFVLVIAAGVFGNQNPFRNLAPTFVWIVGWVGISFLCAIAGDAWRLMNPWDGFYRAVEWLWSRTAGREMKPRAAYPRWLGAWPAFVLFVCFAWMELVWSGRSVPAALAGALVVYSITTWAGMWVFGRDAWLAGGEIFALVFGIFARFASLAWPRRGDNAVMLRLPSTGLVDDRPLSPSMVALTVALLATVTFDGLLDTPPWARLDAAILDLPDDSMLWTTLALREEQALRLIRTIALPAIVVVFIAAYLAVCWSMARLAGKDRGTMELAGRFVLTLVPISLAYHVAHYFSYLFVGGQYAIALVSDPFGWGWDLFGTASYRVDIGLVGPRLQWDVALVSVVVGHIIAVCLAHVVAMRTFADRRAALLTQIPMLILMVGYTMCSLWILSQPITESPAG